MDLKLEIFARVIEKSNYSDSTIAAIRLVLFEGWRIVDAAKEVGKTRNSLSNSFHSVRRRMAHLEKEVKLLELQKEWQALSEEERQEIILKILKQ
ncbi:hypothetical protein [Agarilytica rhodophyticola]|uniref:hypothetical protein n=1 Tax=Agarilytica rhodophyticola TaxID=1737490 RepID=UPI000B34411E|nr:hypothetical protein [Agarilytica rhodophyticola]